MQSDDLFAPAAPSEGLWENLEKRVDRLLETIAQLRNANAHIMKENVLLSKQLKEQTNKADFLALEAEKLSRQREDAVQDLRQVKMNLEKIESLANELKLERK